VLDKDVAADAPADARVTAVEPHASYELRLPAAAGAAPTTLAIQTLESNDEGVAFLVRTGGTSIYFSGDLNSWQWRRPADQNAASEKFFRTELSRIASGPVDLAFVPLDPRLKDPAAGIAAFMDVVGARALFPMHYWDDADAARALMADARLAPYAGITHFEDVCELPDPPAHPA
jgi:L-ascorbate metabolism protein UlaG (beta-lactamase superfamily)